MNTLFFILLSFIGLAAIGFLIALYYRKKPVNIEKAKANLNYFSVSFTTMLATLGSLRIVEDNIELIHSWIGAFTPYNIVNYAFAFLFAIPMVALFCIVRWKKKESKK